MSDSAISVNIVCMDHYLHSPTKGLDPLTSDFRAASIERLPILRIYGSTYEGVKACVHIHGVFPYFYVPCEKDCDNPNAVAYQLALALDKAINITLNQASSMQQHVYSVTLEHGIPFYGFHKEEHCFFKLSFYNPSIIKKASALVQSGNILGLVFQPFECHIPYKQQFMIDFNLFGMNFVRFANARHRDDVALKKQSVCPLEFDVLAEDVLNQYEIIPGNVACNPGIQYIRDEEIKRDGSARQGIDRLESNLTQNRIDVEPTVTDLNYREKLWSLLKGTLSQRSGASASGSTLNDTTMADLSTSQLDRLDISVLDNTQLEEHAQMFMDLWKVNQVEEEHGDEKDLDEDCVLSQQVRRTRDGEREEGEGNGVEVDGDELNFSLLDFMHSLDVKTDHEEFDK